MCSLEKSGLWRVQWQRYSLGRVVPGGASAKGAFFIEECSHGGVGVVAPPHGEPDGGVGAQVLPGSPVAGEAADGYFVAPPLGAPGDGGGQAGEVDVAPVLVGQVLGDELGDVRV
jgi:hypothetical protein